MIYDIKISVDSDQEGAQDLRAEFAQRAEDLGYTVLATEAGTQQQAFVVTAVNTKTKEVETHTREAVSPEEAAEEFEKADHMVVVRSIPHGTFQ